MARTSPIKKKATGSLTEFGSTGLDAFGGFVNEEKLDKLSGSRTAKVYEEMANNDPTVGAFLFAIESLISNVKWDVEPANATPKALEIAEFVKSCKDDMEHSWNDFISEILSMLTHGWCVNEIVYKFRKGTDVNNKAYKSKYNDGYMGWRKLPVRAQTTLSKWYFDDFNTVTHFEQMVFKAPFTIKIPKEKMLMFRTKSRKNNPMGRSILRNAYRPWLFKKRIEEIEGVGIERDLAGLPVAHVPSNLLAANANAEEKASLAAITTLVTNIRRDHQEGVVFPMVYDENGNLLYKLELLTTGGTRQFDTSQIIDRYDKRIAMTVLADFLFLGQSRVGSFALSSDKTDLFSVAIGSFLGMIVDVLNRQAIPGLMEVNGVESNMWPSFKHSDIEKPDMARFCDAVYKLVGVGALQPSEELNRVLGDILGVPVDVAGIKTGVNDNHEPSGSNAKEEDQE